jgi:hypothetical protein
MDGIDGGGAVSELETGSMIGEHGRVGGVVLPPEADEAEGGIHPIDVTVNPSVIRALTPKKFTDNGGIALTNAHIHFVFWGQAWGASPSPSQQQIIDAVNTLLASPYMLGLTQYRPIGRATVTGSTTYTQSTPNNSFTDAQVQSFLTARFNNRDIPLPIFDSQLLYMVVMPPGINAVNPPGFAGEHSVFSYTTDLGFISITENVHYAWLTNGGTVSSVTQIFSHELVEACTDPEGNTIVGVSGTCSQSGWCEIGDICNAPVTVDGVGAVTYWSDEDGACIAPQRVLDVVVQRDDCGVGLVEGQVARFDPQWSVSPSWISVASLTPLTGLTYQWVTIGAVPVGPTNGPSLLIGDYSAGETVDVQLTVTMPNGGAFTGRFSGQPMTRAQANFRHLLCMLSKISQQYVQTHVPNLPPGPTPDPPYDEIEHLAAELTRVAHELRETQEL